MISGGFRTPTPRPFRATRVSDEHHESLPPEHGPLPLELEARLAALETAASDEDFDPMSWLWMGLFGVALPAALIVLGG
jgi:hypothetical protein